MPSSHQVKTSKSNRHRVYHRMSTYTPDQQSFLNFLNQRGYIATLKVFQQEIDQENRNAGGVCEFMDRTNIVVSEFEEWLQIVRKKFSGTNEQFIKIEFMLLVWLCSFSKSRIPKQNISLLKTFIEKKGIKLSENSELLPYFALPYIEEPYKHPFLSKIYTKEWQQEIKTMVSKSCTNLREPVGLLENEESEWFTIVKDLMDICLYFDGKCEKKTEKHLEIMERVKKYQNVIEMNDGFLGDESLKPSELSRLVIESEDNPEAEIKAKSFRGICLKEKEFENLDFEGIKAVFKVFKNKSEEEKTQVALILFALNNRITELKSISKKEEIKRYIDNDILLLRQSISYPLILSQIECLKLINSMCSSYACIKYVINSSDLIEELCKIVKDGWKYCYEVTNPKQELLIGIEEKLIEAFAILQKVSIQRSVFALISKTGIVETLIEKYLSRFHVLSVSSLTYILALILNFVLDNEGKKVCSSTECIPLLWSSSGPISLFELILRIWEDMENTRSYHTIEVSNNAPETQLESIIYSILYVLLSVEKNKRIARNLNFKHIMEQFYEKNQTEYHQKVVNDMLTELDNQTGNLDESEEELNEEDENEDEVDDEDEGNVRGMEDFNGVWIDGELVNPSQQYLSNPELVLKKYYIINMNDRLKNELRLDLVANENLYPNLSALQHQQQNSSQLRNKKLIDNKSSHINVADYDPNKYLGWKKMKTDAR